MSNSSEFVENVERQTWDLGEVSKEAEDRLVAERNEEIRQRSMQVALNRNKVLEARDRGLNLQATAGRQTVAGGDTLDKRAGFYCETCDRVYKDSMSYTKHLNSPLHIRKLGMVVKTKKATVEDVRNRIAELRRIKEEERKARKTDSVASRMKEHEERMAREKLERKARRKQEKDRRKRKKQRTGDTAEDDEA